MKKVFFLCCIVVFCIIHFTAVAAPIKKIRFAVEATYPPFEYIDETQQIKGFDIDLAKAICQQVNIVCTFTNQQFDSLIPSLKIGKFDALISALGITKEREKQVAFSIAYYQPSASFVAALQKHYQLNELQGKTVGVQTGSTFEKYLRNKYGSQVIIKNYASIQDAFLDLKAERIQLVIADTPIAKAWLSEKSNHKQYEIVGKPIIDDLNLGAGYGIAVRKDNHDLLKLLNDSLRELKANGQYDKIANRYFDR